MKIKRKYKDKIIEVWEINKVGKIPDWVQEGFNKNYLKWMDVEADKHLLVGNPKKDRPIMMFDGSNNIIVAEVGDFIEKETFKIISAKAFSKEYQTLEDWDDRPW